MRTTEDESLWEEQLVGDPVFREVDLAHLLKFGDMPTCTCQFCVRIEE